MSDRRSAAVRVHAERETAAGLLRAARLRDPFGDKVHVLLASLYLFTVPLAMTPSSFAFGLLAAFTVARLPSTWPTYRLLMRDRLGWLLLAWTAWHAISILWSSDRLQGLDELGAFRVVVVPLLLWPVIDRITWLVGAFLLGMFAHNLGQFGQMMEWLPRRIGDGHRIRGYMHPIMTAGMCAAAICWHMTAALTSRGWRLPVISAAGISTALVGIVLTGSRGPWIATGAAVALGVVMLSLRRRDVRRRLLVLAVVLAVGGAACWPMFGDLVRERIERTGDDLRLAIKGELRTDVGYRLASWSVGWAIFREHPIIGVGAGGYRDHAGERWRPLARSNHTHTVYMQVLAGTGLIGGVLFAAVAVVALRRCALQPNDHPYADGALLVLVTWLIGGLFDAYHLNSQMFGLLAALLAFTIPNRPPPIRQCNGDCG